MKNIYLIILIIIMLLRFHHLVVNKDNLTKTVAFPILK